MPVEEALRGDRKTLGVRAFSAIHASQTGNRPSVVSQMPMKPSRFASSSEVSPDDQSSPGVNGAG